MTTNQTLFSRLYIKQHTTKLYWSYYSCSTWTVTNLTSFPHWRT